MPRPILDEAQVHPSIRERLATNRLALVLEVQAAIARHPVVVVGMGWNPFPKRARKALDAAGIAHHDLDYGNYTSRWRDRNALKMWTGWPTFPLVFVNGTFVGGATDVERLIASGELQRLLATPR